MDGTVITRFTPIASYDTPEAVERLCSAYEQAVANEKIDSLLLIPIFICDFLCIHPFNDGNGRMSRLLTLLFLYKNGYSVGKYIEERIGKFTGADVVAHCPSIGRSSALAALKKLTEEGLITREGSGRSTFYVRADSK